ncbi:rna recognition domain-containing protein 2 [Vairimorpha apis BRL 01]|uniref:Rna recognition domain-containing protein 2 n=1 Tax=Vairimorpha apis BRL 01 TaxID=1037528 RepID=T0L0K6_9MICR|nr:rna recognition domain-containing protein 2 [Vairimorpha apis BRL 01]
MNEDDYSRLIRSSLPYIEAPQSRNRSFDFPNYLTKHNIYISEDEVYNRLYFNIDKLILQVASTTGKLSLNQSAYLKPICVNLFDTTNTAKKNIFKIDINSLDDRTTCMIKNIPNKYSQAMLIDLLNEHHFGCYDFVYLRMDFKNKCNVGYAFVNFIDKQSVRSFYNKINNKGWKKFSSNKIAELTYASIQGYDNLVNKFRFSSVMKEQENYRPKTFFREGRMKGFENIRGFM